MYLKKAMIDWIRYRYKLARLEIAHRNEVKPLLSEWERVRKDNKSAEERDEVWSRLESKVSRYHDEKRHFANALFKRFSG